MLKEKLTKLMKKEKGTLKDAGMVRIKDKKIGVKLLMRSLMVG